MSDYKKPEITEHSCIKAMELMVKWEAYHEHVLKQIEDDDGCVEHCQYVAELKDKCSVEKLEEIVHDELYKLKGHDTLASNDAVIIGANDWSVQIATALNKYLLEREGV